MKNSKFILTLCFIAVTLIFGVTVSKAIFSSDKEPLTVSATQQTINNTENHTEIIHETENNEEIATLTETEISTSLQTEKNITGINKTEIQDETSAVESTRFSIQLPNIKLPDFPSINKPSEAVSSEEIDLSCFDNTAFIGNSRFISFRNYALVKNAYAVVGLNVDTVFTKSVSGSSVTVINELNGKSFDKVILMFGDNECGWPNQDVFINRYAKVIDAVKERNPHAEIYLHAILPVSADTSAKNEYGCNNITIAALNKKIEQLAADEEINFINAPTCILDSDGALLPGTASDGIHLNKKYSEIWLREIAKNIF